MTPLLTSAALQSPIEYQRRESKSSSPGGSVKSQASSASALRPHASASLERRQQPSLLPHNVSLPSLRLPQHSPATKTVSGQQRSPARSPSRSRLSTAFFLQFFLSSLQVSTPCVATSQAAPPPLPSHQHLSSCTARKHACGTLNGLPPNSQDGTQVHHLHL